MRARLPVLVLLALAAGAARADEAIRTGPAGPPPRAESPAAPLSPDQDPAAIGAWARGVLAGAPVPAAAPGAGCPPRDGKPHGEVWAGVGTHGYREAGGVVTQPLGDCGYVTLGVNRGSLGGR